MNKSEKGGMQSWKVCLIYYSPDVSKDESKLIKSNHHEKENEGYKLTAPVEHAVLGF